MFVAAVLKSRHGYLSLCRGAWRQALFDTRRCRVQAQVRTPPSNWLHEMATCRLFKTKVRTSIRQSTWHSSFFENLASSYPVVLHNL